MKRTLLTLIVISCILSFTAPVKGLSQPTIPEPTQIKAFLEQHPLLTASEALVLGVLFQGEALVIDLDKNILPGGDYQEEIFIQLQSDLDQAFDINQRFMTTFKIEGLTLDHWGQPMPKFDDLFEPPTIIEPTRGGPLTGVRVALSPGHGKYWNETYNAWYWQRSEFWGIREDTLNSQIMGYVQSALLKQGATVIQLRELNPLAGIGVSGYPKWYECSRQYAIAKGLPPSIYDGSNNNYNSDIRARPYMSNAYGADILISLHNNGWNGTLTGTETYYDTNNHAGSPVLATYVHYRIINAIRAGYDGNWTDRGVKSSDDNYGEINYALMPAILIELAFMDRQYPDNTYLHDETFKKLSADAIVSGIVAFWGDYGRKYTTYLPLITKEYLTLSYYFPIILR